MVNNAGIRQVLREMRKSIPFGGKQKKLVLEQVKASMLEYLAEKPDATYDDLLARFGTPEQIAASYLEELDVSDLRRQLTIRKKILLIVSLVAICIILLWTGVVCAALAEAKTNANYTIVEDIEVIERTPISEGENE